MQCQNNLKQLGIACHHYHDAHHRFPAGTLRDSSPAVEDRLSLFVMLLPYLEQDKLARQIDPRQGWNSPTHQPATSTPLRILSCGHGTSRAEHTTLVGVAGAGRDAAHLPASNANAGFFGYDRAVTRKDVKDGLANTLLFIDTTRDRGPWARGGPATIRGIDPEDRPLIGQEGAFGQVHSTSSWNFGRLRAEASVALGDGSARRIHEGMSGELLGALATLAGGEELPGDW
jgi:hypothetical protein